MALSRATALCAAALLALALRPPSAGEPKSTAGPAAAADPTAPTEEAAREPEAPIAVNLDPAPVRGGRATITYRVAPGVDAFDLTVVARPLGAARIVHAGPPPTGPRAAGESAAGAVSVMLDGPGAVDLTFQLAIADPAGAGGRATVSVERRVAFGDLPVETDARPVATGGEVLAEVPALWRPAGSDAR